MDFHNMKRKALQALCKKHHLPANKTNLEMANNLASLLEKPETESSKTNQEVEPLKGVEGSAENESNDATRKAKKVRFCLEEEQRQIEVVKQIEEKALKSAMKPGFEKCNNPIVKGMEARVTRSRKAAEVVLSSPVERKKLRKGAKSGNEEGEKRETRRRFSMGAQANNAVGMSLSDNADENVVEVIDLVSSVESMKTRQRKANIATGEVLEELKNASKPEKGASRRSRSTCTINNSTALDEKSELLLKEKLPVPEIEIQAVNKDSKRVHVEKAPKSSKTSSRSNKESDQSAGLSRTCGAIDTNASLDVEGESENATKLEQAARRSKRIAPRVKEFYKFDEFLGSTGNQKPLQSITNIEEPPRTSHSRSSKRKSVAVINGEPPSITIIEEPTRTSHSRTSKRKSVAVIDGEPPSITNIKEPPRTTHSRTSKQKSVAVIYGEVRHQKDHRETMKQEQLAKAESSVSVAMDSELVDSSNLLLPCTGVEKNAFPQKDIECQKIDRNGTQGSVVPKVRAKKSSGRGRHRKSLSKLPNKKIDSQKEGEVSTKDSTDNYKSGLGCIKEVPEDVNDKVVPAVEIESVELCMDPGLQVNATPESTIPVVDISLKEQSTDSVKEHSDIDEPVKPCDEPKNVAMELEEQTKSQQTEEQLTDNAELLAGKYAKFDESVEAVPINGSSETQVEISGFNEETSSENDEYGQPLSSTDDTLHATNEPTPCYSITDMKDGSLTSSKSVCSSKRFKKAAEENTILVGGLEYSAKASSKKKPKIAVNENMKEHVEGVKHLSSEPDLNESSVAKSQEVLEEKTVEVRRETSVDNLENLNVTSSCEVDDTNEAEGSLLVEFSMANVRETSSVIIKDPLISHRESVLTEDNFNFSNISTKIISSPVPQEGDNDVEKMRFEKILEIPEEVAMLGTDHDYTDGGNVAEDESIGTVPISQAYSPCGVDVDMNVESTIKEAHELLEQTLFELNSVGEDSKNVVNGENDGALIISQAYSQFTVNIEKNVERIEEEVHDVLEEHIIFETNVDCNDGRNVVEDETGGTSPISQACIPNPSTVDVEVNAETLEASKTLQNTTFEANYDFNGGGSVVEDESNEISPISQEAACSPGTVNAEDDVARTDEKSHQNLEEKAIPKTNYDYKAGVVVEEDENKGTSSMSHGYSTPDVKDGSVIFSKSVHSSKTIKEASETNRVSAGVLEYSAESSRQTAIGNENDHVEGVLHLSLKLDLVDAGESSIMKSKEVLEEKTEEVRPENYTGNLEKFIAMDSCKVDDKEFGMKNVRVASSVKLKEPLILQRESVAPEDHLDFGNSSSKTFSSSVFQDELEGDSDVEKMGVEKVLEFSEDIAALETNHDRTDGRNMADEERIRPSFISQDTAYSLCSADIDMDAARIEDDAYELTEQKALFELYCDSEDGKNVIEELNEGTLPVSQASSPGAMSIRKNLQRLEEAAHEILEEKAIFESNVDCDDDGNSQEDENGDTSPISQDSKQFIERAEEKTTMINTVDDENIVVKVEDTKGLQQEEEDNGLTAEFLHQNMEDFVNLNQAVSETNDKSTDVYDENAIKTDGTLGVISGCMVDQNVVEDDSVGEVEEGECLRQAEDNKRRAAFLPQHTDDIVDMKHAVSETDNTDSSISNFQIIKMDEFLETSDCKAHKNMAEDNGVGTSGNLHDTFEGQDADVLQQKDELHSHSNSDKDTKNSKFIEELEEFISDSSGTSPFLEGFSANDVNNKENSCDFESNIVLIKEEKRAESSQEVLEQITELNEGSFKCVRGHFNVECDQPFFKSDSLEGEALYSDSFNASSPSNLKGELVVAEDYDCVVDEEDTGFLQQVSKEDEEGYAELDKNMLKHQEAVGFDYKTMPECEEYSPTSSKASPHSHDFRRICGGRDSSKEINDEEISQEIRTVLDERKDNVPGHIVTVFDENIPGFSVFTEHTSGQNITLEAGNLNGEESNTDNKDTNTGDSLGTKEEAEAEFHLDTGGHATTTAPSDKVAMDGEDEYFKGLDSEMSPLGTPHYEDVINEKVDVEEAVCLKHLEDFVAEKDNAGKELEDSANTSGDTFSFEEEDTGCSVVIALQAHSGAYNVVSEEQSEVNDVKNEHTYEEDESEEENAYLFMKPSDSLTDHNSCLEASMFSDKVVEKREVIINVHENVSTSRVLDAFLDEETCNMEKEKQGLEINVSEPCEENHENQTRLETTVGSPSYDSKEEPENASMIQGELESYYRTETYELNAWEIKLFSEDNVGNEVATFIQNRTSEETLEEMATCEAAVPEEKQFAFVDEENCNVQNVKQADGVCVSETCEVETESNHENDEHQIKSKSAIGSPSYDSKMEPENASMVQGATEVDYKTETYELNAWEIRLFSEDNAGNEVATFIQNRISEETLEAMVSSEAVPEEKQDAFVDEENFNVQNEKQADGVYVSEPCEVETESYHENDKHQTRLETTIGSSSHDFKMEPENASMVQGGIESNYKTDTFELNEWEISLFSEDNAGNEVAISIQNRTSEEILEEMASCETVPEGNVDTFHINSKMVSIHEGSKNEGAMTDEEENIEFSLSLLSAMEETEVHETMIQSTPKKEAGRPVMDEINSKLTKMHISSTVKGKRSWALANQRTPRRPSGLSITGMKENVQQSSNVKGERSVTKRRVFEDLQNIRNR